MSCVVECPYDGPTEPKTVAWVSDRLIEMGCYEVSLGDTIGAGTPGSFTRMLEVVLRSIDVDRVAVHCHDTYGQALANIYASLQVRLLHGSCVHLTPSGCSLSCCAFCVNWYWLLTHSAFLLRSRPVAPLQMGVSVVDASVAGLGGCPYAAGATGNVATEDVLYMLQGLGINTGVDLDLVVDAGRFISDEIRKPIASRAANAILAQRARRAREAEARAQKALKAES